MAKVDAKTNKATLKHLREVRSKLYSIPEAEVDAMSPEDQVKHADSLHQVSLAILKLETAKLKGVNDAFKEKEQELKTKVASLEQDTTALADAMDVVKVTSEGLVLVTDIIKLLG